MDIMAMDSKISFHIKSVALQIMDVQFFAMVGKIFSQSPIKNITDGSDTHIVVGIVAIS